MNFCHRYRLGGALAVLVTIATHGPLSAQTALYTVIDLNLKTEERTNFARTINLFGQVVGRSAAINGASTRAMLWSLGGGVTTLGVLPDGDYSAAFGINESGEVVGTSNTATTTRAFHWAGADLRALDLLPGDVSSEAFAINNHGDVVGYSSGPQGIRAILWKNATAPQIFGTLPGGDFSMAYAINSRGDIAGVSGSPRGKRAVLWSASGRIQELEMLPGDTESAAVAVNSAGQVVGYSMGPKGSRAVLWTKGRIRDLGTLSGGSFSRAYGINELGMVVGTSGSATGTRAFRWTALNGMVDLNGLVSNFHHTLTEAHCLNDKGFIVATTGGGPHPDIESHEHEDHHAYHLFLLVP